MSRYNIFIYDLPNLAGWQFPENWLIVDAKQRAAPCQGCFNCWLKTPGMCSMKDSFQHIGAAIAQSNEVVLVSQCCYGGFSASVKRVLDRSISISLPFFTYRAGRVHHIPRYRNAPALTVCFYGLITNFERETAQRLAEANRINLGCKSLRLLFADGPEQVKEVLAR
nr:flavodoxin family protein [uncultured Oscillibacter sp.]